MTDRRPARRFAVLAGLVVGLTVSVAVAASQPWVATVERPAERASVAAPEPEPPTERALLVSDSAWLSIKNYGSYDAVWGFPHELALASCRRRVADSCQNYDDSIPKTLLEELRERPAGEFDTLIVATGYNDSDHNFESDVETIVAEARERGYSDIVWLTLRENVTYVSPDEAGHRQVFINNNATLRELVASGEYADVTIADWSTYAAAPDHWFSDRDGIHLTRVGAYAAADYVSRKLASIEGWPCPAPEQPGGPVADPCPDPDATAPAADIEALYPTTQIRPGESFELIWTGSGSWPDPPWWK